ncbi:MAG: radical SAM protein [Marinobacter adhaerens]|uniref:Radical SAM protein n=1 Tax=Marinobacter adhaerens TaxID=1033846 RepID=A0A844I007_9GAMM|nr:radical SAM protein [Marinobacter adhaerens]
MTVPVDVPSWIAPIELVVVQGTSFCNLNCKYCYLSEETRRDNSRIPLDKISEYFLKILSSRYVQNRLIVNWHSGEPLVLGADYYETVINRIAEIALDTRGPNFQVLHDFQTNGTLINQSWCDFFKQHEDTVTLGVSCDGPQTLHDAYRRDWGERGTFNRTLSGIRLLVEHDIQFGLIAVISPRALVHSDEVYDFFNSYRDHISEFRFNLLDDFPDDGELSYADSEHEFYDFLKNLLNRLESTPAAERLLNIKNFSYFYERLTSAPESGLKTPAEFMSQPLRAFNIERNGDISTFYAGVTQDECPNIYGDGKGLVVGNLNTDSLDEIVMSEKLQKIHDDFELSHAACAKSCPYYSVCPGGYNLIKYKRFGKFDATETPECRVQVKAFTNALIDHLNQESLSEQNGE